MRVNSFMTLVTFPTFSRHQRRYRVSMQMVRCTFCSNMISPLIASQLPSKARPISSPLPLITGLPELPPVMSLVVMKLTMRLPFSSA